MRPSNHDRIIGDGGRVTVYQRPNGPWYALDRRARKCELPQRTRIIGPAKFDARRHHN